MSALRELADTRPPALAHARALAAAAELVHLVMADGWEPETAAARLRSHLRGDRRLLRHLQARAARALLQHPTPAAVRAAATTTLALTACGQ